MVCAGCQREMAAAAARTPAAPRGVPAGRAGLRTAAGVLLVGALALLATLAACGSEEHDTSGSPDAEEVELLAQLGYVSGEFEPPDASGVVRHDRTRTSPGLNFYTSGHAGSAILMDMEGRILHRWHTSFRQVWPKR